MSSKTARQRLARALQSVASDELGAKPSLGSCYRLVDASPPKAPVVSLEEYACALFAKHRDELAVSAQRREHREAHR